MSTKIKKAKIKNDLFLEATFTETLPGHTTKDTTINSTVPVHADLKNAFVGLDIFLAKLCEQPLEDAAPLEGALFEDDAVDKLPPRLTVECRGFTIGGSDESEGVVLIGRRTLKNKKVLNLVSPFQKWEDDSAGIDTSELYELVGTALSEVAEYLFEGKRAPETQGELPFGSEGDDDDQDDDNPDA